MNLFSLPSLLLSNPPPMLRSITTTSSRLARHAAARAHSSLAPSVTRTTNKAAGRLHAASANARLRPLLASGGPLTIRRALATITGNVPTRGSIAQNTASAQDKKKDIVEFRTNSVLNWKEFPDFASIHPEHVVPAMTALVQYIEKEFTERSKSFTPTWEGTMGLSKTSCIQSGSRHIN